MCSFRHPGLGIVAPSAGIGRGQHPGCGAAEGSRPPDPCARLRALADGCRGPFVQGGPGLAVEPSGWQRRIPGRLSATFLFSHFGPYGMLLLMLSAGVFGLVLCHEVIFTWPIREISVRVRRLYALTPPIEAGRAASEGLPAPALGDRPAAGAVGEVIPTSLPAPCVPPSRSVPRRGCLPSPRPTCLPPGHKAFSPRG